MANSDNPLVRKPSLGPSADATANTAASDVSEKVASFFAKYPVRNFDKHQLIVHADEAFPGIFYLCEGRINQYDITSTGNEVVINVFKPGSFFPMSWAINHTPNRYFFEADTRAKAHIAPAEEVITFLRAEPAVLFDLLARVYRGLDGVLGRIVELMSGNAKNRVIFEIQNAARRFGEPASDGGVFIPLKESDFAKRSGLARETINRLMQPLKADGAIRIEHGGMFVRNVDDLEQYLDE